MIIKTAGNTAITMIPDNPQEEMKSDFMKKHLARRVMPVKAIHQPLYIGFLTHAYILSNAPFL